MEFQSSRLLEKEHLAGNHIFVPVIQLIEVNSRRKGATVECHPVRSRRTEPINERRHFLTQQIVDFESHMSARGQGEQNRRAGLNGFG